jgi:hypothetical protein
VLELVMAVERAPPTHHRVGDRRVLVDLVVGVQADHVDPVVARVALGASNCWYERVGHHTKRNCCPGTARPS